MSTVTADEPGASPDPRRWTVTVFGLLPLPNTVARMSLRERLRTKRTWRDWTVFALLASGVPHLGRARVKLTRWSSREPDQDAIPAAAKHVVDALVAAHVLDDDGPEYLEAVYRHAQCGRADARVELVIEECG